MVKLSRSKIDLFVECPRCFWLNVKQGIKRPPPAPYTINTAIDRLLKEEFDAYREKGEPHPVMEKFNVDAIPYQTPHLADWRNNFRGVQFYHEPTDFLVFGAIDDVWVTAGKKVLVVDYKATGAKQHRIYDSYKRQLEIYQWLLRHNSEDVSPTGYFLFARVDKTNGFSNEASDPAPHRGALSFDLFVEPCVGDDSWIEDTLRQARVVLESEEPPGASAECTYCLYRAQAAGAVAHHDDNNDL